MATWYDPASSVMWVAGVAALLLYQVHHLVHTLPHEIHQLYQGSCL